MIAYFTEAAVVAAQLAGTTHRGLSRKANAKQTTPINLVPLDASRREAT